MDQKPPNGSKISVIADGSDLVIVVPHGDGGWARYFVALFLMAWLGGWFFGFVSAVTQIASGKAPGFLYFWLAGWSLGGAFAAFYLFQLFRPSIPESLRLMRNSVRYDSGRARLKVNTGYGNRKDAWKSIFPKRARLELDRRNLQTLRLRETPDGNRLTVDADALRLELAPSASEVEREWLYQFLTNRYAQPQG